MEVLQEKLLFVTLSDLVTPVMELGSLYLVKREEILGNVSSDHQVFGQNDERSCYDSYARINNNPQMNIRDVLNLGRI